MSLTERLEVRLDKKRISLLKKISNKRHVSIGEMIRTAIDKVYFNDAVKERLKAVRDGAKINAPVGSVQQMLNEIDGGRRL